MTVRDEPGVLVAGIATVVMPYAVIDKKRQCLSWSMLCGSARGFGALQVLRGHHVEIVLQPVGHGLLLA